MHAGFLGYRWLKARGDEEGQVQRRLQRVNARIKVPHLARSASLPSHHAEGQLSLLRLMRAGWSWGV